MIQRAFTLIEVMVAICLLSLISGVIGIKMHHDIQKKNFQTDLERIKNYIQVAQKLAVAMQTDWTGILYKEKEEWRFIVECEEGKKLKPLHFTKLDIWFNGKKINNELKVHFFSSGQSEPQGVITIKRGSIQDKVKVGDISQRKKSPAHPFD